jgi:plasmid stabilization system protein ParE
MPKRLDWSFRAEHDLAHIGEYYAQNASPMVARLAERAIREAVAKLVTLPAAHRPGKRGTREYVMKRFPYTIIYRATANEVRIIRILHQARSYFNS